MKIQTPKQKYFENTANTIIHNLTKRQIEGYYCPDSKSAIEKALELIPEESTIGYGGSMTLEETRLIKIIKDKNYKVIDRDLATNLEQQKVIYSKIFSCDYFLMSTNAITIDEELINIDGRGNRVAFLCFGPQNVLILCGMNKVVPDIES